MINRAIFTQPMIEYTDFAANALQVQEAKAGRELLGNYSRFHFHHPGPVFFYVMAAGEVVFYDWLQLVPAPFNAEMLAAILFNCACWALALVVLQEHFHGRLFGALGIAASVWFAAAVNLSAADGLRGVIVSPWMPHMLLAPFLLFAAATVSAAAGRTGHLPLSALAAGILIHGHVGQLLFAPVLLAAGVALWWRNTNRVNAWVLASCAGILLAFAAPILIEAARNHPNNLDLIRTYLAEHRGTQKTLRQSAYYLASFWAHDPAPQTDLLLPHPPLGRIAWSRAHARLFLLGLALVMATAAAVLTRQAIARRLAACTVGFILLTCALFFVWGVSITGELYQFNGYFVFSLQWLALVVGLGVLAERLPPIPILTAYLAVGAAAGLLLLSGSSLRHSVAPGDRRLWTIAYLLTAERMDHPIRLRFSDWGAAVGVANQMRRLELPFCVDREWGFMFNRVCGETGGTLELAAVPTVCPACRVLLDQNGLAATFIPR